MNGDLAEGFTEEDDLWEYMSVLRSHKKALHI